MFLPYEVPASEIYIFYFVTFLYILIYILEAGYMIFMH